MKNKHLRFAATFVASVLSISVLSAPAQASNVTVSWASSHVYTFTATESGSGGAREIVYTLDATIGNPIFTDYSSVSGNQLAVGGTNLMLCPSTVTTADPVQLGGNSVPLIAGCSWAGTSARSDTANGGTAYTREIRVRGTALTTYDSLIQTLPQPVWAFGVIDANGIEVVFYSLGKSQGNSNNPESEAEQPVVQFAGPLLSRIERSIVDGTGSVTVYGKRLFTVTSATVGGIEVTLTKASKTDKSMVVSFEDLPSGSHDLVLHTTNGKITLRSAVVIK